jgi:hypothetical protein
MKTVKNSVKVTNIFIGSKSTNLSGFSWKKLTFSNQFFSSNLSETSHSQLKNSQERKRIFVTFQYLVVVVLPKA